MKQTINKEITKQKLKSSEGFFGEFGGSFIPPQLKENLFLLAKEYERIKSDENFQTELKKLLRDFVGRPSPLFLVKNLSEKLGFKLYLKREDLNHTGAHKINNTLGQGLLAKAMGKKELIAETGAGQHGVATATIAALLGMKCKIFMGSIDVEKQAPNVKRMKLLGAKVISITTGTKVLKDAVDEALKYYVDHPEVFYLLGSVVGPHPYPSMVRDFQKIIGEEAKKQILEHEGRLPDYLVACVGGGSNALGLFTEFIKHEEVKLIAVEPAGKGLNKKNQHAATLTLGKSGLIHGFKCLLLQEEDGSPSAVYSIASGLDYPGVGPEISHLKTIGRLESGSVNDEETMNAFRTLCLEEGIIPALESSHALAYVIREKDKFKNKIVILNLSGRGDKDLVTALEYFENNDFKGDKNGKMQ